MLLYANIILSPKDGVLRIRSKNELEKIELQNRVLQAPKNGTCDFYLHNLICEFEYLHSIHYTVQIPISEKSYYDEKESTVLKLLEGIFQIIKANIEYYKEDEITLDKYIALFCKKHNVNEWPLHRMISHYITVVETRRFSAENSAEKYIDQSNINYLSRLDTYLADAKILRNNVEKQFRALMSKEDR